MVRFVLAARRFATLQLHSIQPAVGATPHIGTTRMTHLPILILNLHTLCNCRCVMCDIWQRADARHLAAATLERHRESIVSLGVRQVVLTGGEPLLNRELPGILAFFRSLPVRVTLLTSGLLLEKRAELLAEGVDEIIVSLDGPTTIHDAIRRIPRGFETIASGVKAIRRLRPAMPIACRTTVQKQNHTYLRATVQAAHQLSLDSVSFLPADLSSSAFNREQPWDATRKSEIALDASEVLALDAEIELLIATHRTEIHTGFIRESESKLRHLVTRFRERLDGTEPTAPRCNAPWVSAVMEVDGSLRPCFFHDVTASTMNLTLAEALNSPASQAFRARLDVATNDTCRRCVCSLNYRS
jgi:MoaA/NifB/PqqE/SkfB family radical SAM enzyme